MEKILIMEQLTMPTITFTVPLLKSYQPAIGLNAFILYSLLGARPAGTATQIVNADIFASTYGPTNDQFAAALGALARQRWLTYAITDVRILWVSGGLTADMTADTLRQRWAAKILDDRTYYLMQILLLSKTPGATEQRINPTAIASSWNITVDQVMTELRTLVRQQQLTTVDLADVNITWLVPDSGFTRTEEQTRAAIARGLGSAQHDTLMALLHTKGAAAAQTIDADAVFTNWKIDNTKLFADLQTLKRLEIVTQADSNLTLVFTAPVTTTMTEAELKAEMGTLSANDYTYLALKREYTDAAPADRRLIVTPTTFEAEWGVKPEALSTAARTLSTGTDKKFNIDLAGVNLTWLISPSAQLGTIAPTNLSISQNTPYTITLDTSITGSVQVQWVKNGTPVGAQNTADAAAFKPLALTAGTFGDAGTFGANAGPGQWAVRFTRNGTSFDTNTATVGN